MKELSPDRKIIITAGVNLAVAAVCLFLLVPTAINNDDYIIHYLTAGAYGEAGCYTYFANSLLGRLLVLLQGLFPALNCFSTLEFLLVYLAFTAAGAALWLGGEPRFGAAQMLFCALALSPFFYNELHYTKIAVLLGCAGLLSLLRGLELKSRFLSLVGAAVALFGSLFRLEAFLAGATLAFFPFVFSFFRRKEERRRLFCCFAALFLTVFALAGLDRLLAAGDGAGEFYEYCPVRSAVSDYELPPYDLNSAAYDGMGLSANDLQMIRDWSFADGEVFSTETLGEIVELRGKRSLSESLEAFLGVFPQLSDERDFVLMLAALLLMVLALKFKRLPELLLTILVFCGCCFYMCYIGRFARWVTSGLVAGCTLALLFSARRGSVRGLKVPLAITLAVVSPLYAVWAYGGEAADYSSYFMTERAAVYESLGRDENSLYLFNQKDAPAIERVYPTFSAVPAGLFNNICFLGGWDTLSPARESVLERFGVTGSPYRALVESDSVYLVAKTGFETKLRYVREHYCPDAALSLVGERRGYFIAALCPQRGFSPGAEKLLDCSARYLEADGSFLEITAVCSGRLEGEVCAALVNRRGEQKTETLYRASAVYEGEVTRIWLAVPTADLSGFGEYSLSILSDEGSSAESALSWQ